MYATGPPNRKKNRKKKAQWRAEGGLVYSPLVLFINQAPPCFYYKKRWGGVYTLLFNNNLENGKRALA